MKTLLTLLLLQIPLFLIAQNPTIFFDKTRCQKAIALEMVDTIPHSFILVNHLQKLIRKRQITKPVKFTLWKLDGKIYTKLQEASIYEICLLPSEGFYFLQLQERIYSTFIEINLNKGQLKSKIFFNCVRHD